MDYPFSILEYFVVGMVGAGTFLFLLLMFDKRIKLLENEKLCHRWMCAIYIVLGGALSAIVNLSSNPNFGVNQFTLAFTAGMGWPALAAGFSAAKKIGEVDEEAVSAERTAKTLVAINNSTTAKMAEYTKGIREQNKKTGEAMKQAFEKELDRIRSFYEQKFASNVGR